MNYNKETKSKRGRVKVYVHHLFEKIQYIFLFIKLETSENGSNPCSFLTEKSKNLPQTYHMGVGELTNN